MKEVKNLSLKEADGGANNNNTSDLLNKMDDDSKRAWVDGPLDVEELLKKESLVSDISADDKDGEFSDDEEGGSTSAGNTAEGDLKFEKNIQSKYTEACKAMGQAHYKESLNLFELILSDLLARFGGKHKRVGSALHNVAIASLRAGNLPDAMDAIEEAIKIRSKALGRKHPKVTDSLVEYGIILLAMEQYSDAEKVFEGAINLRKMEKLKSCEDANDLKIRLAKVYNNLGCVYFDQRLYDSAKKSFHEAIRLLSEVYGLWNKMTKVFCGEICSTDTGYLAMASTLCNTAFLEMKFEHYEAAIIPLRQSLEIQKEVLGTENKLVKSTLESLAFCYLKIKEHKKALKVYQEIFNGQQKSRRATSDEKIEILQRLVYCDVVIRNFEKALEDLSIMEDIILEAPPTDNSKEKNEAVLYEVRKLMGEVNYQVFKYPTFSEAATRTIDFFTNKEVEADDNDVEISPWEPETPDLTSKLSGHRIAVA